MMGARMGTVLSRRYHARRMDACARAPCRGRQQAGLVWPRRGAPAQRGRLGAGCGPGRPPRWPAHRAVADEPFAALPADARAAGRRARALLPQDDAEPLWQKGSAWVLERSGVGFRGHYLEPRTPPGWGALEAET